MANQGKMRNEDGEGRIEDGKPREDAKRGWRREDGGWQTNLREGCLSSIFYPPSSRFSSILHPRVSPSILHPRVSPSILHPRVSPSISILAFLQSSILAFLKGEQPAFPMEAAGKSAQAAAGGEDAMTRNQEGDGVGAAGAAHRPRRFGRAQRGSQTAIGFGLAGGDLAQGGPDFSLKGRSRREVQGRQFAGRAALQHPRQRAAGQFVPAAHGGGSGGVAAHFLSAGKVEAGEAGGGIMGGKNAERGLDGPGGEDDGFGFHRSWVSGGGRRASRQKSEEQEDDRAYQARKTGCGPRASRSAKGAGPGCCPPPDN